jgi:hypothetical protein
MKENYLEDLRDIKEIMNRSSRFISLSGLSGISAGIIALIGIYLAHHYIFSHEVVLSYQQVFLSNEALIHFFLLATGTLIIAVATTIYFTTRTTKKKNQNIWDHQTRRLLINLLIPLVTGGILCVMLIFKGLVGLTLPLTLIFYGLALVNASKYTLDEIRALGIIEIVLGLVAFQFIGSGLIFWAMGFGVVHLVYGVIIQWKYQS